MSKYSRLASTDEQEQSIVQVERAFKKANTNIGGTTCIGKHPQTVIMDIYHHDSKIYINADGVVKINNIELTDTQDMVNAIMEIRDKGRQP